MDPEEESELTLMLMFASGTPSRRAALEELRSFGVIEIQQFADEITLVYADGYTWTKRFLDFSASPRPLQHLIPRRPSALH